MAHDRSLPQSIKIPRTISRRRECSGKRLCLPNGRRYTAFFRSEKAQCASPIETIGGTDSTQFGDLMAYERRNPRLA
ncbi:MAG: hypothetical protein ABS79_05290 [Planctomycetes bacterium SCN 63-9]|nr:MAG: hypothetical protein ABS79_05290 [Planctomycetes bacterium SCN 63-9]